jgi:hypothetical protein
MQNVFVEKWPLIVKIVLMTGAVLFVVVRWA